jgi:SAM-dependent methyltransferase
MAGEFGSGSGRYRGAAEYYDRFRLPYPDTMIADLVRRAAPSGHGRLLDLACGTGQLAFPLRDRFAQVWAVDAEPDMTETVRAKARAAGAAHVRTVTVAAEELHAEPGAFELIVVGNAFHRLHRDPVARRAHAWLEPGGTLALCWSTAPWAGPRDWQRVLDGLLHRWRDILGVSDRVPADWDRQRRHDPDRDVLSRAGLDPAGRHEFAVEHHWTVPELAGFIRSTSFLPPPVLAHHSDEFTADLTAELGPHTTDNRLTQTVDFAYELARKRPRSEPGCR